ncbi:hypothetical protein HRI_001868600 [Hibiscus trionum]|uniref:Reverse transcriptase domain-containing protein n=1 Tax=Hibiscus trionum TaxID=183268 RepID=A0A9W7LZF7_HIBTR|nr:hypothetical protein HRI_001868600 [Hibiscus trionum]
MKLLSWNVRGLGKPRTVGRVKQKLRVESPSIIFFMETKVNEKKMARIRSRCGFPNGIDVGAVGRSGGLSMGWKSSCNVSLRSYSKNHIDVLINDDSDGLQWRCTGFYGALEECRRTESWDLMRSLNDTPNLPWVVIGDFNEIFLATEKQGGRVRNARQMDNFRTVVEECSLLDLGYTGPWFTWEKGRFSETNIRERLDRGLANPVWEAQFPDYHIRHLSHSFSDHRPILLNTGHGKTFRNRIWHFRFESAWLVEDSCISKVERLWTSSSGSFLDRLKSLCLGLDVWFKQIRKDKGLTVADLNKKLESLNSLQPTDNVLGEIMDVKLAINFELDKEELYWEQRARSNWLKYGDRNTAFFHRCATQRKRRNKIRSLENDSGVICMNEQEMGQVARNYFTDLFTTKGVGDCSRILEGVACCIDNDMNNKLTRDFDKAEFWEAVKSMQPLKAAGEDGLGALFYQKFWHVLGNDVVEFCTSVLAGTIPMSVFNHTRIVLIPKNDSPTNMSHFRPISLCNVLFKIISKVLVNRFQAVLHLCIDESQSAFVPGRLITDNVLAAFEIIHSMRSKRVGKKGHFALKLDMSKAYDRVEWPFIEAMMKKMGFSQQWISLIMLCISSVSYSVVLNGQVGQSFTPTRGLRQGDPLSPYLFLLCGEGLSSLLRQEQSGIGIRITRSAPRVSHLFFADDSLIFGEVTTECAARLLSLLEDYERCSGQVINYSKSGIFFSSNCIEYTREDVCRILRVSNLICPEKYLGLPMVVGRNRKKAFMAIRDRVVASIIAWSPRSLSQGGKEVYIKAILQSIPTYTMSCFLLPKTFCRELEAIMARFWWQHNKDQRGIHWCLWSDLCHLKENGGLGFRDMAKFNIALLAKQEWRLVSNPSSLVARLLRAKYFPTSDFLHASLGSTPSLTWKSIWSARGLLEKGLRYKVGSGGSISIWNDFLLPGSSPRRIQSPPVPNLIWVSDLIEGDSMTWKVDLIRASFISSEAEEILCIPISRFSQADRVVWSGEHSGIYSVRSGYRMLLPPSNTDTTMKALFQKLWNVECPSKMKIQCWKFLKNLVPTKLNLCVRRVTTDPTCFRCLQNPENVEHVLRNCPFAEQVWAGLGFISPSIDSQSNFSEWLSNVLNNTNTSRYTEIILTIWALWTTRNKFIFEGEQKNPMDVITSIKSYVLELRLVSERTMVTNPQARVEWSPPEDPYVKVNVDAGFRQQEKAALVGIIIRNTQGQILGASSSMVYHIPSTFAAEAHAVVCGLRLAADLGFSHVAIEGDSGAIINKLRSPLEDPSDIGALISEAKGQSRVFQGCTFLFRHRSAKKAAHALTTLRRSLDTDLVWIEETPAEIEAIAADDRRSWDPP